VDLQVLSDEELYDCWFSADALDVRHAAGAELERRYRRGLRAHCYRLLGSPHLADEAVNDAFLRLFEKHREFTVRLRAWIWATAHNRCLELRKDKHHPNQLPAETAGQRSAPVEDCVAAEERIALDVCLGRLLPGYRAFFELCVCDAQTYDQAADVVGWHLSPAGYNYRFLKCLKILRDCLKKAGISY
jgi:RNA polymerase sigma factor (sigma-70 family)